MEKKLSENQRFWTATSYAVIGNDARMKFPIITYGGLKENGKKVFAVDPNRTEINGDATVKNLASLPETVEAVIIETPTDETAKWVEQAINRGIKKIWVHQGCESKEAISIAKKAGVALMTGCCAVMYLKPHSFPHVVHKWIMKVARKY